MTQAAERPSVAGSLPSSSHRPRFEFLDGLRALAALSVTAYHAFLFTGRSGEATQRFHLLAHVVLNGHFAVPVFIVLSGFVLMLPLTKRPGFAYPDGAAGFLRRRARRILPPYFAAFAVFLVLIVLVPAFRDPRGTAWAGKVPVTTGGLLSHLLLVQNLRAQWHDQVDGPLWSVATEFQLYLLMPLVLLPLWRRYGGHVVVALAVVAGTAVHVWAPGLDGAHYWYCALFAAGMLAAQASRSGQAPAWLGRATAGLAALTALVLVGAEFRIGRFDWAAELVVGGIFSLFLWWLATPVAGRARLRIRDALESRPLLKLGSFSYSIYLVHSPVLGLINLLLIDVGMPLAVRLAMMWLVAVPVAVGLSYLLYLAVERRFLTAHQREVVTADP